MTLTINGVGAKKISSARRGVLPMKRENNGAITIRYAPGIGEMLRLER